MTSKLRESCSDFARSADANTKTSSNRRIERVRALTAALVVFSIFDLAGAMNSKGLLAEWQKHHGPLAPEHREQFLARPEVVEITEYSNAAIQHYLPYHPRLKRLLHRLRSDGRTAVKRTPSVPRAQSSTRESPRKIDNLSTNSGMKPLKKPNNPNVEKTKSKKDRPNRSEMNQLRGIAQSNKWWE